MVFVLGIQQNLQHLELTDRIITALDNHNTPLNIFLDLSKAFDTLHHRHTILSDKLLYYGIRGTAYNLLRSYLANREQFVELNDTASKTERRGSAVVSTCIRLSRRRPGFAPRTRHIIWCKNLALYIRLRDCVSLCLSDETLKAVGSFYLASMPGEVKDPTSLHWKCVTCRGLHNTTL